MGLLRALEARLSNPDVSDNSGDGYYVRSKDGRKVGPMVGARTTFLTTITDVAYQPVLVIAHHFHKFERSRLRKVKIFHVFQKILLMFWEN